MYVYEAKVSLLLQLSRQRSGAERLVEARIFQIFGSFDVLGFRPSLGADFLDGEFLR